MSKIYDFERAGELNLEEPIDFVCIQAVAYRFLVAKTAFFIQHRDRSMAPGDTVTKEQRFKTAIAEAHAQGHIKVASPALWRQAFLEEMYASKASGNQVFGSAAALWSSTCASMQLQSRWAWLRPSHINQLHSHHGDFTMPGPGKIADPYSKVLLKFGEAKNFMRTLFTANSAEPQYF